MVGLLVGGGRAGVSAVGVTDALVSVGRQALGEYWAGSGVWGASSPPVRMLLGLMFVREWAGRGGVRFSTSP